MCTVIILRRPGHAWPLLLAANRDERIDRAWDLPDAWWPDQPGVVGGRDQEAGGTWMAVNGSGVVAAVLNRPGSLGPAAGKRSRGELPLLALQHATAAAAAAALVALPANDWRPYNLVVADRQDAVFVRGLGEGRAEARVLPAGVSMVTAHDPNDLSSPRTARHLPRFRAMVPPQPDLGDWGGWKALITDDSAEDSPADALFVPPTHGFGTVCSSLLGLGPGSNAQWHFKIPQGKWRRSL